MIWPINLATAWRSACVMMVRDTRRSVPPSFCAGHWRWQHGNSCLVVSTSNHTRHAISRAFPEHPFPPWFLPNSIGGQTSCWRELLRKTSGTFGGTCANKNHWTIVSTDKWPDKRVENSIDSICIMDAAATKSRLQGKMVNVIRSFSITGSFLDRIGNRTDARTEYIYIHTHTHAVSDLFFKQLSRIVVT